MVVLASFTLECFRQELAKLKVDGLAPAEMRGSPSVAFFNPAGFVLKKEFQRLISEGGSSLKALEREIPESVPLVLPFELVPLVKSV